MGERHWFPRRVIDGLTAWSLITALLVYYLLGGLGAPLLARLLSALLWPVMMQGLALSGAERGIRVDDDGLAIVSWRGPERHLPWSAITGVFRSAGELCLTVGDETVRFDTTHYPGWRRLLRLIETRLAGDEGETVGRDEISELLGCDPDRGLTCSAQIRWLRLGLVGLVLPLATSGTWLAAVVALSGIWAWATLDRRRHWVHVDGHGLEIRRGRTELRLAWSEVDGIEVGAAPYSRFYATPEQYSADALVRLNTVHGPIEWLYSDRHGSLLADAIRRVLEARAAGRRLPDPGLVTNASISLARVGGAESDRSISRITTS